MSKNFKNGNLNDFCNALEDEIINGSSSVLYSRSTINIKGYFNGNIIKSYCNTKEMVIKPGFPKVIIGQIYKKFYAYIGKYDKFVYDVTFEFYGNNYKSFHWIGGYENNNLILAGIVEYKMD